MKNKKGMWLFYLALAILFIAVAALIVAIVAEFLNNNTLFSISGIALAVAGPVSIILLIMKFIFFGGAPSPEAPAPKAHIKEKDIPVVDVKEVKKSQDEIMYEKYVDLYNRKVITKEDLEKKRIELLGK